MSRTLWVRAAIILIAAGGLWLVGSQQPPPVELTLEKVADDLHVIVGSGGNVAVLITDDGVILVDDKFDRNIPDILAKVRSLTSKPVRYVLNTHHHGDHTGGNAALGGFVEMIAHKNARANIVKNSQPGVTRLAFSDEFEVHLGGKEVRARHLGFGHTNGDAVMYFPAHRVVHTGDLFVRGTPFIDYSNGGSSEEWMKTLDNILAQEFDLLIPGHGAICKREDLMAWKASFETVRGRVRDMVGAGKTREEVEKELKIDDQPGWSMSGLFSRSLPGLYEEMARLKN